MKDWQSNKKVHDKYWGNLYNFISNNIDTSDFQKSWTSLNRFELGSDIRKYAINDVAKESKLTDFLLEKSNYLQSALDTYISSETDCIIELGSGWGRNILNLSNNNQYKNIDFIAGELSTSGQKVTKLFANTFNLNVKSVHFNWHDPNSISDLLKDTTYKNIVIYSYYSIEQIKHIDRVVFENLLQLDIDVKFVSIEPVAFQYLGKSSPWSSESHYNLNLKECLSSLEDDNFIKIDKIHPLYFQPHTTPAGKNGTLIQWKKI